jgi:GT2 family glycosyltransferase
VSAPDEVRRLAGERAAARDAKDFARADALRDEIASLGWSVTDTPDGFDLQPIATDARREPVDPNAVESLLDHDERYDVTIHWVCEGWLGDIDRAIAGFRRIAGDRRLQYVVADVTGEAPDRWADDEGVEVVWLTEGTGWAAARNAGLRRSLARVVLAVDGSVEPTADALTPLCHALEDPDVGVCGPFGLVTDDLREFDEAPGAGACDAIEGYLMAFRREVLSKVGGFDEKFKWYRTADIEWSFRVKDAGYQCAVVPVPVAKHEHRAWAAATDEQRASWSKRNFYRFLDRYRDRWDLVQAGAPAPHGHEGHHHHEHEQPVTMPEGR